MICILDYGVFDFIIIGGGTSGSVLANRLSEIEDWNILLLEAGDTENDFTDIPAMNYYLRSTPMNWGYFTKPQENSCLGKIRLIHINYMLISFGTVKEELSLR